MQSLNSLYFPETTLPRHLRNCLLLLPDTLHLLQPVESKEDAVEANPAADIFMEQGICQVYTPSPLGKERERFTGLLNEIQTRKDFFVEQLSSLTLAHMSKEAGRGEHSSQAIKSTLLDGEVPAETAPDEDQEKATLWQARLILALAEILDKEEAELATSLSDIDDIEQVLFQDLKGEEDGGDISQDDNPLTELMRIKAKMSQPRPGTMKRRLQAWETFYSAGSQPASFWFWMTSQEEAAELLISDHEKQSGGNAAQLLLLDLPEQIYMRETDALKKIKTFQEKAVTVRRDIMEALSRLVNQAPLADVDPVALLPDAGVLARDWNDLIEYHFPEDQFGRKKLDIQFLANRSLDQVVGRKSTGNICHGIVALFRD